MVWLNKTVQARSGPLAGVLAMARANDYCHTMSSPEKPDSFWKNVRPAGAIADFYTVFQSAGRHRWRFVALAAATTWVVLSLVIHEEARIPPRLPEITYITSWHAGRSDAEILAGNIANQQRKDRLAAEQAKRDAMVRGIYKSIGRASGMDVDAIDAKAQADAAAEAKASAAREARLYGAGAAATAAPAPKAAAGPQ